MSLAEPRTRSAAGADTVAVRCSTATKAADPEQASRSARSGRMPRLLPMVLLPAADVVALVVAVAVTGAAVWTGVVYGVAVLAVLAAEGQHRSRICLRVGDQIPRLAISAACPAVLLLPWAPPMWLGCTGAGVLVVFRGAVCGVLRSVHRRGMLLQPTVIVGASELGLRIYRALREHPELGLLPEGFLDDGPRREVPVLGRAAQLGEVVARHRITRVLLCESEADLVAIVRACRPLPADVCVVPRLHELGVALPQANLDEIWGVPVVPLRRWTRSTAAKVAKRVFDVVLAAVLLVLLAPLLLTLALAVRLGGGTALFRQRRVTGAGRSTEVVKLRTVARGTEPGWTVSEKDTNALGRWLRGTHFDELPQLAHVLRGRMSIVGPRPERPCYAERFTRELPRYADRHRVPGGMTGWAQVHGLHGDTSIPDRADFDNRYIENWSPWLDVVVVARTAVAVLAAAMGGVRR